MDQVRRRSRWDRTRDLRRNRPRTPAPTVGWVIRELSAMTGVSVRTLRNYVSAGLITPTELRGNATRYQRKDLMRLLIVIRERKETKLTLAEMKTKLDAADESTLDAWVRERPLPLLAAAALGILQEPVVTPANAPPASPIHPQAETWQRVQLLPGLELLLGPNASPAATRAAAKIASEFLK